MILYSVIPAEIVFGEYAKQTNEVPEMVEMEYLGERIQAKLVDDNYVIERVFGTSLKSFLDMRLQPGTVVKENGQGDRHLDRK